MSRYRTALGPWLVAGAVAWVGLIWIGWMLWQSTPPRAGFDLTLLLDAARAVASGRSPYDPAILAGASPEATDLFYSYPPPVAQAMTLLARLPDGVVLIAWAAGATAGVGLIAGSIARALGAGGGGVAIRAIAVAPLVLPFGIAILFGNLDVWYPLAYGALLLSALPRSSRRTQLAAGAAVAIITIAKLQPAPLLLWVAVVAIRQRGGPQARVLGAALVTALAIVAAQPRRWWHRSLAGLRRGCPGRRGGRARGCSQCRARVPARAGNRDRRRCPAGRAARGDARRGCGGGAGRVAGS